MNVRTGRGILLGVILILSGCSDPVVMSENRTAVTLNNVIEARGFQIAWIASTLVRAASLPYIQEEKRVSGLCVVQGGSGSIPAPPMATVNLAMGTSK